MFDNFEEKAKKKLPDVEYKKSRQRRRHINDNEDDALENLEPRDKFRIKTFIPVMDALESSLAQGLIKSKSGPGRGQLLLVNINARM